jgi:hypothetical protein
MLSDETLQQYREMTNGERLKLALQMTDDSLPYLLAGPPDVVDRRFELLNKQNDERNQRILEAIARTRQT